MNSLIIGRNIVQKEGYKAFITNPFPPKEGLRFSDSILKKSNEATRLLGKLDGITKLLPDSDFFLLMYLRKDAASSSQIEGTMATMIDAIEAEVQASSKTPDDVDDILHYIKALDYGIKRVQDEGFPITLRFLREIHEKLMHKARTTHHAYPGEFRRSQNWIGGTNPKNAKFVPPPVEVMHEALRELEQYIHSEDTTVDIIKAGLIHAQFETIHPFTDGNGRTGRMLVTFYLWKVGLLEKPVLFLSSFFKKNQMLYYEKLSAYHSDKGDVEEWIHFFLDGVIEIANEAIITVEKITKLREADVLTIQKLGKRASESAALVLPKLYGQPIVSVAVIQKWTGFTRAGALSVIHRFIEMGILVPRDNDSNYNQTYIYTKYVEIFSDGE
jgi:Fic family protein